MKPTYYNMLEVLLGYFIHDISKGKIPIPLIPKRSNSVNGFINETQFYGWTEMGVVSFIILLNERGKRRVKEREKGMT